MRLAIICKPIQSDFAFPLIEILEKNGKPVQCIFVETSFRKKFSKNEITYKDAHNRFNQKTKKHGWLRVQYKKLWDFAPRGIRQWLWLNIHRMPMLNKYSIEHFARNKGIKTYRVYKHSSKETKALLEKEQIDYVLLVSSNWLIKEPLLSMDKTKIINAHGGILPENRGLDANVNAILVGGKIGITTHFVDADIDTGPILQIMEYHRKKGEGLNSISRGISLMRREIMVKTLDALSKPGFVAKPQNIKFPIHTPLTYEELVDLDEKLKAGQI